MKTLWNIGATGAALCFAVALAGCGGNSTSMDNSSSGASTAGATNGASATTASTSAPSSSGSAALTGAGSTFINPLMSQWIEQYNAAKSVKVDYQSVGSGAGIKQLTNGTVDFAASDAPLNAKEKAALPGAVTIPATAGAVVIAYNLPGGPNKIKLTGPVLADIYQGKIKTWNDPQIAKLNTGTALPATNIAVAHRSDGSGTSYIFTSYLSAVSPEWKTKIGTSKSPAWPVGQGGKGSDGVSSAVKGTAGGIGYVELAYAVKNKLSYALVQNQAGQYVEPSADSVTAAAEGASTALAQDVTTPIANASGAKAYPIAGFTYILVPGAGKNADKTQKLKDFLTWAVNDGQKAAPALNYAPLPKAVVDANTKAISGLK